MYTKPGFSRQQKFMDSGGCFRTYTSLMACLPDGCTGQWADLAIDIAFAMTR